MPWKDGMFCAGTCRTIQKIVNYHERSAEAQQALEAYLAAREAGKAPAAGKLDVTVQEVFEGWRARKCR